MKHRHVAVWASAGMLAASLRAQHQGHTQASEPVPVSEPDPMVAMDAMEPMDHWMTMVHGYAYANVNRQGGPSGDRDFESQNHLMATAIRSAWGGKLSLLGTFSLEPATVPASGSPQLFQRGEAYHGVLLVNRQHPHDLFIQLAAAWERPVSSAARVRLYVAPIGEPALGPAAYPHRLSASEDPTAPLSHHNQDSTHIAADVVTLGLTASVVTLEGSAFHGQEPDENRWNIDQGGIDSYSGRLTIRPAPEWSLQVSSGHLEHPEELEDGNQTRSTASISYQRAAPGGFFAATLATGKNQTPDGPEWGTLLEWTWKFANSNFVYGRVEAVDRDLYELTFQRQRPESVAPRRTRVDAATLGFVRNVNLVREAETGVGADLTLYRFSSELDPVYGAHPLSFHGFLRVRFGSHTAAQGSAHGHGM